MQLVTGGPEVGAALTTDRRIGAVSFTGSAAVGHQIARDAAPTKVLLELGSNAALVVAADADLDAAADAVVRGGYYASGQACISVQRVIVVDAVREEFVARLTERVAQVVVGDPRDPATRVSALIDERSTKRVCAWLEEAVEAGARWWPEAGSSSGVIEPVVLLDVRPALAVWDEEVLAPWSRYGPSLIWRRPSTGQRLALRTARERLHQRPRHGVRRARPPGGGRSGRQRGSRLPLRRHAVRRRCPRGR